LSSSIVLIVYSSNPLTTSYFSLMDLLGGERSDDGTDLISLPITTTFISLSEIEDKDNLNKDGVRIKNIVV